MTNPIFLIFISVRNPSVASHQMVEKSNRVMPAGTEMVFPPVNPAA
jgi:hypothetical protein